MDFMSPPTFDILNIQTWKVKMSLYLKAQGIHVYFATINDSYCLNGKNIEANAKALCFKIYPKWWLFILGC